MAEVYRADNVGSLLRSAEVKEAREAFQDGRISGDNLSEVEDRRSPFRRPRIAALRSRGRVPEPFETKPLLRVAGAQRSHSGSPRGPSATAPWRRDGRWSPHPPGGFVPCPWLPLRSPSG